MQNSFEIPEGIKVLITDFLKGVIDEKGLIELNHWVLLRNENLEEFNLLKSAWLLSGKTIPVSTNESDLALSKIKGRIIDTESARLKPFWSFTRIAASWLLFLTVGGVIGTNLIRSDEQESGNLANTIISAPLGAKSFVELPDGTKVWINAGSKIAYDNNYGKTVREIQLTGEAYFSVKGNKKIPFLVRTSDIVVKALGTKFNVKAYPDEGTITTTLEEGKVVLSSSHNSGVKDFVELQPRQKGTFFKGKGKDLSNMLTKEMQEDENVIITEGGSFIKIDRVVRTELLTSWKDDTWIIQGEPLGTLAPILERRFDVLIIFDSDESKQFKFTGKIRKETIEQIMEALELTAPIHYKINNNSILIKTP